MLTNESRKLSHKTTIVTSAIQTMHAHTHTRARTNTQFTEYVILVKMTAKKQYMAQKSNMQTCANTQYQTNSILILRAIDEDTVIDALRVYTHLYNSYSDYFDYVVNGM